MRFNIPYLRDCLLKAQPTDENARLVKAWDAQAEHLAHQNRHQLSEKDPAIVAQAINAEAYK